MTPLPPNIRPNWTGLTGAGLVRWHYAAAVSSLNTRTVQLHELEIASLQAIRDACAAWLRENGLNAKPTTEDMATIDQARAACAFHPKQVWMRGQWP